MPLDLLTRCGYFVAKGSRIKGAAEVNMAHSVRSRFSDQLKHLRRRKSALTTGALLALLLFIPMTALAQGSPFDTGFNAIQTLFTGTIAKVASLVAIVIGGYGFAHGGSAELDHAGM